MGRFDSLKGSNEKNKESNPFKKGGRRKEKNEKTRDFSKMKGTMPLPGLNNNSENKSGKYVAPGLRNKHRSRNTTPKDKPVFKTEEKFREKAGDFPELVPSDFPELKAQVVNKTEEKPISKWANIVADKETEEEENKTGYTKKEFQEELKKLGPVRPGWVRLRMDKITKKTIFEYGPPTQEHIDFMARQEWMKKRKAEKALEKRLAEYEEYNRMMNPDDYYINSWEYDDHVHHEEWLRKIAEDDGHFDLPSSDYDSEEYYSDEY